MAQVVTQNDLNDIIQSAVSIAESSTELVNRVSDAVTKIKIINESKLKTIKSTTISVIDYLSSMITYINSKNVFDNIDIQSFDVKISKVFKAMSDIISFIPKSIDALSKMDLGWKSLWKLKFKLRSMPSYLKQILSGLKESLEDIAKDSDGKKLLTYFSSAEAAISEEKKNNNENVKTQRTIKRQSIFDVVLSALQIFKDLGDLGEKKIGPKALIKMRINVRLMVGILKSTISDILKAFKGMRKDTLSSFDEKFQSISHVISNFYETTKILLKGYPMLMVLATAPFFHKIIVKVIQTIKNIIDGFSTMKINDDIVAKINIISHFINKFTKVLAVIILTAPLAVLAAAASVLIATAMIPISIAILGILGLFRMLSMFIRGTWLARTLLQLEAVIIGLTFIMMGIIGLALTCVVLSKLESEINFKSIWSFLGNMALTILALLAIGVVISLVSGPMLIIGLIMGAVVLSIIMFIGSLVMIALGLNLLATIPIESDKIINNLSIIFVAVNRIVKYIGQLNTNKREIKDARKVLRQVNRVVRQLKNLAITLNEIQSIKIDSSSITNNITKIFETIKLVEAEVQKMNELPEDASNRQRRRLLRQNRKEMRLTSRYLGRVDDVVSEVYSIAQMLEHIQKLQLDDAAIINNIVNIFSKVKIVEAEVQKMNELPEDASNRQRRRLLRQNRKEMRLTSNYLGRVDDILAEVSSIADSINSIQQIEIGDKVVDAVKGMFGKITSIIKLIDEQDFKKSTGVNISGRKFQNKMSVLNDISKYIKSLVLSSDEVTNTTKVIDQHTKFIDKLNNVNVESLKTASNMFEKMAQFSESINGNFEGLANTLNEKIAPLMEELKGLLEGVQNKVEETGANMSKAAYNSGKTLSEPEMTAQVNSENPKADAEEKARIVQQRMEEQARAQTNALVSKIDELIELFKNGQAQVRTA